MGEGEPFFEYDAYPPHKKTKSKPEHVKEWGYWIMSAGVAGNRLRIELPPGKYSIEFAGGERYANKIITFDVADKDIDLGRIVLKKK